MLTNHHSQNLGETNRLNLKLEKLNNMKSSYNHMEPYSKEFIMSKKKAFERYKKAYPVE